LNATRDTEYLTKRPNLHAVRSRARLDIARLVLAVADVARLHAHGLEHVQLAGATIRNAIAEQLGIGHHADMCPLVQRCAAASVGNNAPIHKGDQIERTRVRQRRLDRNASVAIDRNRRQSQHGFEFCAVAIGLTVARIVVDTHDRLERHCRRRHARD
jgi:hypothetical protein